jgi:sulfide dehydrogenase cytochrome subunit
MNVHPRLPGCILAAGLLAGSSMVSAQPPAGPGSPVSPRPPAASAAPAPGAAGTPSAATGVAATSRPGTLTPAGATGGPSMPGNRAAVSHACAGCHGTGGVSAGTSMPSIAGLPREYLRLMMQRYKTGARPATVMNRLARGYSDEDFRAMADFFEAHRWVPASQQVDGALVQRGQAMHEAMCSVCHLDNGRYAEYTLPRLAGQWLDYLQIQVHEYKHRQPAMPQPKLMKKMLDELGADDLNALAHFYASQH